MAGLGRRSHYRKHLTDAVLNDLPEPDESIGQRIARVVGTRGGNMFDVVVAPLSSSGKEGTVADHADGAGQSKGAAEEATSKAAAADGAVDGGSDGQLARSADEAAGDQQAPIHSIQKGLAPQLAFLPTKFRKLVWIKRNDFVIVECGEEESEDESEKDGGGAAGGGGFRYVITHILYKDQVKHIKSKGLWPSDPYFAEDESSSGAAAITQDDAGSEFEEGEEPDGTYEDNGIVFDDPLGDDNMMVNTNRIATLRVEDSSSDEESDDD